MNLSNLKDRWSLSQLSLLNLTRNQLRRLLNPTNIKILKNIESSKHFLFLYKFLIPSKSIFGFEHFRLTARGRGIDESAWKWGFWENEVSYLQQILSHFSRLNILTFKWSKSWVISKLNGPKEWKWTVIIYDSYKIYMIHTVYIKMMT